MTKGKGGNSNPGNGKENDGYDSYEHSRKIRALEEEKDHYTSELRRHTEEVEGLKREKSRLQASVAAKEAIAAARRQ